MVCNHKIVKFLKKSPIFVKILLKLNKNYFYEKFLYKNEKTTKILDKITIK